MRRRRPNRRFTSATFALATSALALILTLPNAEHFDLAFGADAEDRLSALDWSTGPHRLRLIDRADDALASRIALIRDARDTIDMSTFMWRDDRSGHQIFAELEAAARRGVRIRLLGDAAFFLRDPPRVRWMATRHHHLTLRMHNPVDGRMTAIRWGALHNLAHSFKQVNRRMHIKLLIADSERVLLGGRNIGDEYFGRNDGINFIDRDVVVEGAAVAEAERCFDTYWRHAMTRPALELVDVAAAEAQPPPEPVTRAELDRTAIGDRWHRVDRLGMWWDRPQIDGLKRHWDPDLLANRLAALIGTARKRVLIESPYLILSERTRQLLSRLRAQQKDLRIVAVTNSLAATDNWQTYAAMFSQLRELLGEHRMEIHAHRPEAWTDLAGTNRGYTSIHAKTFVIDERYAATGSYNMDPRSGYFNSELLLVIEDPTVVTILAKQVLKRTGPEVSWVIHERRRPVVIDQLEELAAGFHSGISKLIQIDLWPLEDHDYYQLIEGPPVPPHHPAFHHRYRSLGPFPQVSWGSTQRIKLQLFGSLSEAASPTL